MELHHAARVSVLVITHNQERYLAQAVQSAVEQDTDFQYEVVIGEDCSSDGTRRIALEMQRRYPHRVRVLPPMDRLGVAQNLLRTLAACRGEYVALLEGDDYWLSRGKLQQQVEFLDRHPECAICFHNVMMMWEDGRHSPRPFCPRDQKTYSTLEDLIRVNFIPTCSAVFRRRASSDLPPWFPKLLPSDWVLHVLNAEHGVIGYIDAVMGVYRIHPAGLWSGASELRRTTVIVEFYEHINRHFHGRYVSLIAPMVMFHAYRLLLEHSRRGALSAAAKYAWKCLTLRPFGVGLVHRIKAPAWILIGCVRAVIRILTPGRRAGIPARRAVSACSNLPSHTHPPHLPA